MNYLFKNILKVNFLMVAMIFSLLLSACSSDSLLEESGMSDETVSLTFHIEAEDLDLTRNSGDLSHINKIIGAVYDVRGNLLPEFGNNDKDNGQIVIDEVEFPLSLDIKLIKGQQYNIVFWGQNSDCDAFDTSNLKAVKVEYSKLPTIGNECEAFSKSEVFTVVASGTRKIVLTRVFARLNIIMESSDYESVVKEKGTVSATRLSATFLYNTFNAVTNEVAGQEGKAVFNISPIGETELAPEIDTNFDDIKLLASAFMFAPSNSKKYDNLNLEFFADEKNTANALIVLQLNDIPLQRNWNTNIFLSAETVLQKESEIKN